MSNSTDGARRNILFKGDLWERIKERAASERMKASAWIRKTLESELSK